MVTEEPIPESQDFYKRLGVGRDASDDQIRKAYRKIALKWHPDKNPNNRTEAEKKFKNIAEAYACLSDPVARKKYDSYQTMGYNNFNSTGFDRTQSQRGPFYQQFGVQINEDFLLDHMRMTFDNARRIFEDVFGTFDPFNIFDDDPLMRGNARFGSDIRPRSMFERSSADPFSFDPFLEMDNMASTLHRSLSQMQSISNGMSGIWTNMQSSSTSVTRSPNGDCVTTTKRTSTNPHTGQLETRVETLIQHSDGRVERHVTDGQQALPNNQQMSTHRNVSNTQSLTNVGQANVEKPWIRTSSYSTLPDNQQGGGDASAQITSEHNQQQNQQHHHHHHHHHHPNLRHLGGGLTNLLHWTKNIHKKPPHS